MDQVVMAYGMDAAERGRVLAIGTKAEIDEWLIQNCMTRSFVIVRYQVGEIPHDPRHTTENARLEEERGKAVSTALVQPVGAPLSPECRNSDLCGTKISQTDDQGRMAVLPEGFVMRDGTFRCRPCRDEQVAQSKK